MLSKKTLLGLAGVSAVATGTFLATTLKKKENREKLQKVFGKIKKPWSRKQPVNSDMGE
jgi:hypothetical protein